MIDQNYTYVRFKEYQDTGKTKKFYILSKENDDLLGEIKWYPSWRKYIFHTYNQCVFEQICLGDIIKFLDYLKKEREGK